MRFDPIGWAVGFIGCLIDWLLTRSWRRILFQLLPLLLVGVLVLLVICGMWLDRDRLAQRYMDRADAEVADWEQQWAPEESVADGEAVKVAESDGQAMANATDADASVGSSRQIPAFAEVLYRRVKQLHSDDKRSTFFIALKMAEKGATQQALGQLNRIAPDDREGYLPAHAWLTQFYFSQPITLERLRVIKHHAANAVKWSRTPPSLLAKISELFKRTGDPDTAVESMQRAADRDGHYYLSLAELTMTVPTDKWKMIGAQSLKKSEAFLKQEFAKNPNDVRTRLQLAQQYLLAKEFSAAEQLLIEGLKDQDDPSLKRALSETYRLQFVYTAKLSRNSWTGNIELLERALHCDPTNLTVFDEVAKLARITGKDPDEQLMAALRELLAEGRATSVTHMWLSERFLITGDLASAVPHLDQAVKRDPTNVKCLNNLAYCLSELYPERRQEALDLADQAVKLRPDLASLHDTRGTILMALERSQEAIAAFERAIELSRPPLGVPNPEFHERLSQAYVATGDQAMADTHLQYAKRLREQLSTQAAAVESETESFRAALPDDGQPPAPAANSPVRQ